MRQPVSYLNAFVRLNFPGRGRHSQLSCPLPGGERLSGAAMDCAECVLLLSEHEHLKQAYAKAVDLIFATGYRATDSEHKELKNSAEESRVQLEIAALNLEKHKRTEHSSG